MHDSTPERAALAQNGSGKGPRTHRQELIRALIATAMFGAAGGIVTSILNNYLSEVHGLGAEARGWLEFPSRVTRILHHVRRRWPDGLHARNPDGSGGDAFYRVGCVGVGLAFIRYDDRSRVRRHLVTR